MKTALILTSLAALCLTSCTSLETTVTAPDGTVTRTVAKGVDSGSVAAAVAVAGALSPLVIPEK